MQMNHQKPVHPNMALQNPALRAVGDERALVAEYWASP